MNRATITLSAALALSLAGNLYGIFRGETYQLQIADPVGMVEMTGGGKAAFGAKVAESGARGGG